MPKDPASHELDPTNSLEGNLALWQQELDRLEAELPGLADGDKMPEWYDYNADQAQRRHIASQLKEPGVDLSRVSQYVALEQRSGELQTVVFSGFKGFLDGIIRRVSKKVGADLIAGAFAAETEDGPIHSVLLGEIEDLSDPVQAARVADSLTVLQDAYHLETKTDILGIKGTEYEQKVRGLLLSESGLNALWYQDDVREQGNADGWKDWAVRAVAAASGLKDSDVADYTFSATRNPPLYSLNGSVLKVIEKLDHFGYERLKTITDFTGIHGLESYTVAQLEHMERLALDPKSEAQRLEDHDVTVVMVNRFGDHNEVMRNSAEIYDDEAQRTLFFEIASLKDIYKYMSRLHRHGIKPSTLVLAAHSLPGQFVVTDERFGQTQRKDYALVAGRKLVARANASEDLEPGMRGFSMHGMQGMARLVRDYMQPSRAIDDADSDLGRRKIILQACEAATEVAVNELDEHGEKRQQATESVISQLGSDLVKSGLKDHVDIYGAEGGIQVHRTPTGMHYSEQPQGFDLERNPIHATRVRLEGGKLVKQDVEDVALRKLV